MPRRFAPLLLAGALAAGCGGQPDAPSPESFRDGPCRTVAPDVIAVGRAVADLGDGPRVDDDVLEALRDAQDAVFTAAQTAPAPVGPALEELSTAVGALRIRADGRTYEPSLGESVERRYDAVLDACGVRRDR